VETTASSMPVPATCDANLPLLNPVDVAYLMRPLGNRQVTLTPASTRGTATPPTFSQPPGKPPAAAKPKPASHQACHQAAAVCRLPQKACHQAVWRSKVERRPAVERHPVTRAGRLHVQLGWTSVRRSRRMAPTCAARGWKWDVPGRHIVHQAKNQRQSMVAAAETPRGQRSRSG